MRYYLRKATISRQEKFAFMMENVILLQTLLLYSLKSTKFADLWKWPPKLSHMKHVIKRSPFLPGWLNTEIEESDFK